MSTVSQIVTRALRRITALSSSEAATAEDAVLGRERLNSMILGWAAAGVDAKYTALALTDTFYFFVPPQDATSEVIDALAYLGTWNASTNTPTLADGTGTKGDFYKVSTAGSTSLDDLDSWAVNDFAVFNGSIWLQSLNSSRFEQAVIDLLAVDLTPDFGMAVNPVLMASANRGWMMIQSAYIKAPTAIVDRAVMRTMQRIYLDAIDPEELGQ